MLREKHLLQRLRLLLLLVATLGSSYFVPLPPPLPPLHLMRRCLGSIEQTRYLRFCKSPTTQGNSAPHLSPAARLSSQGFERTVRAGAGPIGTQVDAEPAGQPLVLDGQPQLLFHNGGKVGEVAEGESDRWGQTGHQSRAADISQ